MIWIPVFVAVIYGFLYSMMLPREFGFTSPLDPYYFSLTTMSSVGYGDFSPKTTRAKLLVMTQHALVLVGVLTILEKISGVK